jgi:hypothetical protein
VTRSAAGRPGTGLLLVALLVSACGTVNELPTQTPVDRTATPSTRESDPASLEPTAAPGIGELHVGPGQLWSIVVPPGWEVVAENAYATALSRGQAIAEILVAPSSGLTAEELEAQRVDELSTWPGVAEVESDFVRVPAGDALRVTMATTELATSPAGAFILYVIEEGDTQYVISVRGPHDKDDLLTEAEAFAESFAILD